MKRQAGASGLFLLWALPPPFSSMNSRVRRPLRGRNERDSRIRLLPRVCDGEARLWPGVQDVWFGEPVVGKPRYPLPSRPSDCGRSVRSQSSVTKKRKAARAGLVVGTA